MMKKWFGLTTGLEERLRFITGRFHETFGESLSSLVLFGSAVGGEWHPDRSDINLVVEFDGEDAAFLDRAVALKRTLRKHNISCQWFTRGSLARSADVFPVEILDLILRRRILLGEDPLADAVVFRPDLRLACERQAREKLLALRSAYAQFAGEPRELRHILIKSATAWGAILQAILYLSDSPIPSDGRERALAVGERLKCDTGGFQALFEWRKAPSGGDTAFLMQLYRSYLRSVCALVDALDSWENV